MPFRFAIDSQLYDLVNSSQSGEVVRQWQVPLRHRHDIEHFINKLLEQNEAQLPELKRYLSLTGQQQPKDLLVEQLEKGQLLIQKGTTASGGGAAKAPTGSSPYRAERASSQLFSNPAMRQVMGIDEGSVLSRLLTAGANQPRATSDTTPSSQESSSAPDSSEVQTAPATASTPNHKLCIEIAGRARCHKQRLEISAINGGTQPSERQQTQSVRLDHQHKHRGLVEFKRIPNAPRDLTLVIATSGPSAPIRLPLVSGHPTSDEQTSKAEWDTVIIPVRPLGYINKARKREQSDLLKPGYVYVFWNNKLWRELEVGPNQALRDINVEFHRRNWNGNLGEATKREAEGHWLSEVWVPYKLNGADQSGQLTMLYSEAQLDFPYLESLETDSAKLQAKGTALAAIAQYSGQQSFSNNNGDVGDIETALLDQQIDPASGYEIISEQGRHLKRARQHNIPTAYLAPIGEKFVLQIEDSQGNPFANKPFTLKHASGTLSGVTDGQGVLEVMVEAPISAAEIELSLSDDGSPSHRLAFKTEGDALPDVSTVKGQQLRLNNLGYNAGVVDGLMGRKTRAAAKGFQKDQHLDVDGIIGPKTQAQLKKAYGQ